jgi:hypothetical protein
MPTVDRIRAALPVVVVLLITVYGALLRLNVITSRYGPIERPGWARVLTERVAPLARYVEPQFYAWAPVPNPYVGGDPITYLKFARELRSFYQGHVREPLFLIITRAALWLLDGQDVGISFASAAMSTLGIVATYLLGRAAFGPTVGVLAALGVAIDYDLVNWSAGGWRDDTFAAMFVFASWAFVRLRNQPSLASATLAGILSAAACLTRITSVSWIAPALLVTSIRRGEGRQPLAMSVLAATITAIVVAPYLINCARETGDPFVSINAHTRYYRAGEGLPHQAPQSAFEYIRAKVSRRPLFQADTVATGIFVWPFQNKWFGFNLWLPYLADAAKLSSVAGLLLFLASPNGRLLLVLLVSSLVPYAFTWNVAGGGEWRFTMHAYPIYLIAAVHAPVWLWRTAWSLRQQDERQAARSPRRWITVAAVVTIAAVARGVYTRLPYFVQREALAYGEEVTIAAGRRDDVFYTAKQWSEPRGEGAVTARVIIGQRAAIQLPLPNQRPYRFTLRMDPVTPTSPRLVSVLLNGRLLNRITLGWNPGRVGMYSVDVDADLVRPGEAVLQFVADTALPARNAGPRYKWLAPDTPVSLRVWYVRIHPL